MSHKVTPPNKALFDHLKWARLVVDDIGDGCWGWSPLAKSALSDLVRMQLGNLLYNDEVPSYLVPLLNREGFDANGRLLEKNDA